MRRGVASSADVHALQAPFHSGIAIEDYQLDPVVRAIELLVQVLDLAEQNEGRRPEALYTVALGLGLREGEVLGLRWRDISLEQHTLRVAQTVQRIRGGLALEPPKTERSARLLPLPLFVERALLRHAERQALERRVAGDAWKDYDLVFPSAIGTPLDPRNLLRQFKALLVAADLPDMRFHDLRHSCATTLIAQGVHPRVVQEILGHSQISTTMNVYGHVLDATRRVAAEAMDGLFLADEPGADDGDEPDGSADHAA